MNTEILWSKGQANVAKGKVMLTTLTNYLHIPINFIKQPWNHRIGKVKKKKKKKPLLSRKVYFSFCNYEEKSSDSNGNKKNIKCSCALKVKIFSKQFAQLCFSEKAYQPQGLKNKGR